MRKMHGEYDAVVVGGGPAGATTATVLAQYGHRVLLIERDPFPRYHIGESLMPYTWFTFDRLGVLDWFERAGCPQKHSVQFVSTSGKVSEPFYFFQTIEHPCATTWQVRRSDFDQMMLENAAAKGAEVRHGLTVRDVVMDQTRVVGVIAEDGNREPQTFGAKVVVDGSQLSSTHCVASCCVLRVPCSPRCSQVFAAGTASSNTANRARAQPGRSHRPKSARARRSIANTTPRATGRVTGSM